MVAVPVEITPLVQVMDQMAVLVVGQQEIHPELVAQETLPALLRHKEATEEPQQCLRRLLTVLVVVVGLVVVVEMELLPPVVLVEMEHKGHHLLLL